MRRPKFVFAAGTMLIAAVFTPASIFLATQRIDASRGDAAVTAAKVRSVRLATAELAQLTKSIKQETAVRDQEISRLHDEVARLKASLNLANVSRVELVAAVQTSTDEVNALRSEVALSATRISELERSLTESQDRVQQ